MPSQYPKKAAICDMPNPIWTEEMRIKQKAERAAIELEAFRYCELNYDILTEQKADGTWVAAVAEWPEIGAEGETLQGTIKELKRYMRIWCAGEIRNGRPIPMPNHPVPDPASEPTVPLSAVLPAEPPARPLEQGFPCFVCQKDLPMALAPLCLDCEVLFTKGAYFFIEVELDPGNEDFREHCNPPRTGRWVALGAEDSIRLFPALQPNQHFVLLRVPDFTRLLSDAKIDS